MKSVEIVLYQATETAFEYLSRAEGTMILVRCSDSNCSDCSCEGVDSVLESVSGSGARKMNELPLKYWQNDRSDQVAAAVDLIDMMDVLVAAFPPHYTRMLGLVRTIRIALFESFRSRSICR